MCRPSARGGSCRGTERSTPSVGFPRERRTGPSRESVAGDAARRVRGFSGLGRPLVDLEEGASEGVAELSSATTRTTVGPTLRGASRAVHTGPRCAHATGSSVSPSSTCSFGSTCAASTWPAGSRTVTVMSTGSTGQRADLVRSRCRRGARAAAARACSRRTGPRRGGTVACDSVRRPSRWDRAR